MRRNSNLFFLFQDFLFLTILLSSSAAGSHLPVFICKLQIKFSEKVHYLYQGLITMASCFCLPRLCAFLLMQWPQPGFTLCFDSYFLSVYSLSSLFAFPSFAESSQLLTTWMVLILCCSAHSLWIFASVLVIELHGYGPGSSLPVPFPRCFAINSWDHPLSFCS